MPYFITPLLAFSIMLLFITGIVWGIVGGRGVGHIIRHRRKDFVVLSLDEKRVGDNPFLFFKKHLAWIPVFEVAVHHLGKAVHYYIVVPAGMAQKIKGMLGASEVQDYVPHYHESFIMGGYLSSGLNKETKHSLSDINIKDIDFSKINEIGEGVAMQFIFRRRNRGELVANIRIMVSAPSQFQAKEIFSGLKAAFPGFRVVEIKNPEFVHRFYFREFFGGESVAISI